MEIKHIYWFAYLNISEPSVRYRAKYPLQQLNEKHNIGSLSYNPGYNFRNLLNFLLTYFLPFSAEIRNL